MTDDQPPVDRAGVACDGPRLTRRGALLGLAGALTLGGSRVAFAQGPVPAAAGDARFVVVILRGALDGLSAVPAYGDPAFGLLRGSLALPEPGQEDGVLDLGGRFGMHPKLARLHEAYRAGEALVVHAVAGPHRSRSHFDAQDMLESGAAQRLTSGWLNRALTAMPARQAGHQVGLAVGLDVPLLMKGSAAVQNYVPGGSMVVNDDLMARIEGLLAHDATLGPAFARGRGERVLSGAALRGAALRGDGSDGIAGPPRRGGLTALADAAGRLLAAPDGPRVAALEVGGFDTHLSQTPRIAAALTTLDAALRAVREGLGDAWRSTSILVLTELGRTVRINCTAGTDHGTGGVALLLGGAVAGGMVRGDWPGLGAGQLYEDRDLQPTTDMRAIAKGLLRDHLRLPAGAVEEAFPDSRAVEPMGGLVRA